MPVVAQNVDEAFKTIMSGGTLANTKENALFKSQYNAFSALNSLDEKSLGKKMSDGDVTPKMDNLLARFSPDKYAKAKKIADDMTAVNDINTNASNLFNTAS